MFEKGKGKKPCLVDIDFFLQIPKSTLLVTVLCSMVNSKMKNLKRNELLVGINLYLFRMESSTRRNKRQLKIEAGLKPEI